MHNPSGKELIAALQKQGWEFRCWSKGTHVKMRKGSRQAIIPAMQDRLMMGVLGNIKRACGFSRQEWEDLFKK